MGPAARADAADLLRALADEHRDAVVAAPAGGPRCVHELVDLLEIDEPLVSQHLCVLRAAHLLQAQRRGKEVVCSLADHHVAHIVDDAISYVQEPT